MITETRARLFRAEGEEGAGSWGAVLSCCCLDTEEGDGEREREIRHFLQT